MRLQPERPPDAGHRALTEAAARRHGPRAPVGGVGRLPLERQRHDVFHLRIADRARGAGARVIEQPVQSLGQEPTAPLPHRLLRHAQLPGDARVRLIRGASENDPRALRERLGRRRPPRPAFQRRAFLVGERQGWDRSAKAHARSPFYSENAEVRTSCSDFFRLTRLGSKCSKAT